MLPHIQFRFLEGVSISYTNLVVLVTGSSSAPVKGKKKKAVSTQTGSLAPKNRRFHLATGQDIPQDISDIPSRGKL